MPISGETRLKTFVDGNSERFVPALIPLITSTGGFLGLTGLFNSSTRVSRWHVRYKSDCIVLNIKVENVRRAYAAAYSRRMTAVE
ncbi:hypothetical protein AVEN_142825-1 [Araneus ventricosus]|uniref:Uncharacterized protein n=1 Tax=Araneus ventricosus TaxID=182803 RepID=A0A4Y2XB28_ARAVE|nr:hypothetical protein AVEN_142825-1 [Araneus ventricosus]